MKNISQCPFCRINDNHLQIIKQDEENIVLMESKNFLLVPALGPIAQDHMLVITKNHVHSLTSLSISVIREYEKFLSKIKKAFRIKSLLEFEHGSVGMNPAGASVVHAHVHLLPRLGCFENIIENRLPRLLINNMFELHNVIKPHIWLRGRDKLIKVYLAKSVPSQFLRRVISNKLGHNNWNWRKHPRRDRISKLLDKVGQGL